MVSIAFITAFVQSRFAGLGGHNEDGAVAIEYGLLAGLIALAIVGGATALGVSIGGIFGDIAGQLNGVF